MKKGYDVFGKAYGVMLRNDLHDKNSIEHKLLKNQVLLDLETAAMFYQTPPKGYSMLQEHELFAFSRQFLRDTQYHSVEALMTFTSGIASEFSVDFADMYFGGTEKEILERGTDWCFDMARAAAVLLDCMGIPARFLFLANPHRAYCGHVVLEAYYQQGWGVLDPIFGYIFFRDKPIPAKDIHSSEQLMAMDKEYRQLYEQIAVCEYNPMEENTYAVTQANAYYRRLNSLKQDGSWLLNEDK